MSGFEVGIVGGPGDGQVIAVPSRPGEIGPPRDHTMLELLPPLAIGLSGYGDERYWCEVDYYLRVNESDDGPLWHYVRNPHSVRKAP